MKKIFKAITKYFKGVKKEISRIRWTTPKDLLKYSVLTKAKDEKNVMEPYLAHMVKNKTNRLVLRMSLKKEDNKVKDVKLIKQIF